MAATDESLDEMMIKEIVLDVFRDVKVISIKSEQAVAEGEHYLSTLLRAHVSHTRAGVDSPETTSIILKTHPKNVLSDFIKESQMFKKEILTYNKILPRIHEILGRNITPAQLGSERGDVLVLEDLKLKGFQMANRVEKLDFYHASESLKVLADFHAASILVHKECPELFDDIKVETHYTDNNIYMRSFVVNTMKVAGAEFEKIPELSKYGGKLQHVGERIWERIKEEMKPKTNEINVFNHGDFWTTNILFNYDDKNNTRIKDINLVDFQFCRWGSPAFDLQLLFTTSIRCRDDIPKLTAVYLERLNQHLHPNILTPERLDKELRRMDCFGFVTSICTLPICISDSKNPLNFGETTKEDFTNGFPEERPNPYLTGLRDVGYLKVIPGYLEFYEKNGFL